MTLHNPVDDDRLKLFPKEKHSEYLRQCDMRDGGCNDAQLVHEMRKEGTLKVLNPDDYEDGNGIPAVRVGLPPPDERAEGFGFRRGDRVIVTYFWPWGAEDLEREVLSVTGDGFIRASDNQFYPVAQVKRANPFPYPDFCTITGLDA